MRDARKRNDHVAVADIRRFVYTTSSAISSRTLANNPYAYKYVCTYSRIERRRSRPTNRRRCNTINTPLDVYLCLYIYIYMYDRSDNRSRVFLPTYVTVAAHNILRRSYFQRNIYADGSLVCNTRTDYDGRKYLLSRPVRR